MLHILAAIDFFANLKNPLVFAVEVNKHSDMEMFWQIFAQVVLALCLAAAIFVASHLLGQRGRPNALKDSPYECGIATKVEPIGPFSIKFYKVALLFIIFDVELAILLPWAFSFQEAMSSPIALTYLIGGITFIVLLSLGLVYEIAKGGLEWDK